MAMEEKKNDWFGLRPKWVPAWLSVTFVVFVIFTIWVVFYGDSSYIKSNEYSSQIKDLKHKIKENQDTTKVYEQKLQALNTDVETLERIARENFGMKRENEDVYETVIP